jgi:hypothetical protein
MPALVGFGVSSDWVRTTYPVFCQAAKVRFAPPYKDFARELGLAMPRKRTWPWRNGKRLKPRTWYDVRDPSTNVVAMKQA